MVAVTGRQIRDNCVRLQWASSVLYTLPFSPESHTVLPLDKTGLLLYFVILVSLLSHVKPGHAAVTSWNVAGCVATSQR